MNLGRGIFSMAIERMNNTGTFAASSPKTIITTSVSVAFFVAAITALYATTSIGCQIPMDCCTAKSVIVFGETGGDSLSFFIHPYFSFMPKTMKIALEVKHSSHTCTPTERNTVSRAAFLTEKNAKNKAYAFILQHGLLEDFRHFINSLPDGTDPHGLCVDALIKQASTWKD